ncbi:ATP-dependent nuclease [Brevundimonas aurifodinae]|uniref:AAA family ATPase n=1 Tax=Brevundimonas aurifodinae TaxID=1508312 RepID=A0ABV1NMJ2_9CAUL
MRIVLVEVRNFRGIRTLDWTPSPGMNCLIGPGDATKTTILDAIELALSPRTNYLADDTDFYNLDFTQPATVTITVVGLPDSFRSDARYGFHLRGWDETAGSLSDEPDDSLEDALSIRVSLDASTLEGRWSLFHLRLDPEAEPPSLRFADARDLAPTRLGPYADRHLGWGRQSVLNRIGLDGRMTGQLAAASRAAREAFRSTNKDVFVAPVAQAEKLSRHFSVRVRDGFTAELDVQGSAISSGGVVLHAGSLPLRTLGTGSSRLIVSALQHNAGGSHIALVDEVEHGLEPHRIARLLKYLLAPPDDRSPSPTTLAAPPQIFLTTHSEVVIRELRAQDIHTVRCDDGLTTVRSVSQTASSPEVAQRHLRAAPGAFLARRVLVGEGRTEYGLLRGLDVAWIAEGKDSFALAGVVAVDGGGVSKALALARHLSDLGFDCLAVLDSDEPPSPETVLAVEAAGGVVLIWPDDSATDERLFLDLPWAGVVSLLQYASSCSSQASVVDATNAALLKAGLAAIVDLDVPSARDCPEVRTVFGRAAKAKAWFKTIEHGEAVAAIVAPLLAQSPTTPLASHLRTLREWIDG